MSSTSKDNRAAGTRLSARLCGVLTNEDDGTLDLQRRLGHGNAARVAATIAWYCAIQGRLSGRVFTKGDVIVLASSRMWDVLFGSIDLQHADWDGYELRCSRNVPHDEKKHHRLGANREHGPSPENLKQAAMEADPNPYIDIVLDDMMNSLLITQQERDTLAGPAHSEEEARSIDPRQYTVRDMLSIADVHVDNIPLRKIADERGSIEINLSIDPKSLEPVDGNGTKRVVLHGDTDEVQYVVNVVMRENPEAAARRARIDAVRGRDGHRQIGS